MELPTYKKKGEERRAIAHHLSEILNTPMSAISVTYPVFIHALLSHCPSTGLDNL